MQDNTHYVCTGSCSGLSSEGGAVCGTADCPNNGNPFVSCNCTDKTHADAASKGSEMAEGETTTPEASEGDVGEM